MVVSVIKKNSENICLKLFYDDSCMGVFNKKYVRIKGKEKKHVSGYHLAFMNKTLRKVTMK